MILSPTPSHMPPATRQSVLPPGLTQLSPSLFCWENTCRVYILRSGEDATLVDFGDGSVMDALFHLGIQRVTDVLMTHHHRDQGQGLSRAAGAGARIWAPHAEQDLFQDVGSHWQARPLFCDYNPRQDRFSLIEPVRLAGTLHDYAAYHFGPANRGHNLTVLPTPGHTPGAISLLAEIDGLRAAFCGDLMSEPGKVPSLAATQWSYGGSEGLAASILSLLEIKEQAPAIILPSHGAPLLEPGAAIDLLVERLWELLRLRNKNPRLLELRERPYEPVTSHVLRNRTSVANSYVLLSETGKALLIDFGYDFMVGFPSGADRASRRPWLYNLKALKRDFGVIKVDVVLPTHAHDDHIAGINLLREVEQTQVWAAESFARVMEDPARYDLPCLWYDPVPVDVWLPLEHPVQWEEYTLTLYPLAGHTRDATAILFEADGRRFLATGDQYQADDPRIPNYLYRSGFEASDYCESAGLYRRLQPDVILSGHGEPVRAQPGYLDALVERGKAFERLHQELLPLDSADFGAGGFGLRIQPYQAVVRAGERVKFILDVRNPYPRAVQALLKVTAPQGWPVESGVQSLHLMAGETRKAVFYLTALSGNVERRARVAVDLTLDGRRFGQQAEALVTVSALAPLHAQPPPAFYLPFAASRSFTEPVLDADFPDPSVLHVGDTYYAYATNLHGIHVQAARSRDLARWELLPDALPDLPAWAVTGFRFTWSPVVSKSPIGDRYILHYATRYSWGSNGIQAIGVAAADRPEGPFRPAGDEPLICQTREGGSIDPSVFIEEDGRRYLLWKNDGNAVGVRSWIYMQQISGDGLSLVGRPKRMLTASQPWEGELVEAPTLWKHCGQYFLFYSANHFTSDRYAVGYAVASSLWGPYRKAEQPLLSSGMSGRLAGPGGQDILQTPDGDTYLLFHAWAASPDGKALPRYRNLHLARLDWVDDRPVVHQQDV